MDILLKERVRRRLLKNCASTEPVLKTGATWEEEWKGRGGKI